jgi:cytidylate kinase
MAIITISRGSFSMGKEIAERVAERLGYRCLSRDVLLQATKEFDIPEVKLIRAIHDAPSILERFTNGKERYVACFRKALLEAVRDDNVVYHGLAGHFFLEGVEHVFKVRIVADLEERARFEAERENISEEEARHLLQKDDEERRKWSLFLYGIDTTDPSLYDLLVRVRKLSVGDAADMICGIVESGRFDATDESRAALERLIEAAKCEPGELRKMLNEGA